MRASGSFCPAPPAPKPCPRHQVRREAPGVLGMPTCLQLRLKPHLGWCKSDSPPPDLGVPHLGGPRDVGESPWSYESVPLSLWMPVSEKAETQAQPTPPSLSQAHTGPRSPLWAAVSSIPHSCGAPPPLSCPDNSGVCVPAEHRLLAGLLASAPCVGQGQ